MELEELKLSKSLLLIIECCKENPSKNKIKEYSKKIKDWNDFIYKASVHGVLPLIYNSLKALENSSIPSIMITRLKDNYFEITKENMMLTSELIKITKLFDQNHIKYISFKGPTLSQAYYGNITLRQYCDLDILVKYIDIKKIIVLLEKIGYKGDYLYSKDKNSNYLKVITFVNEKLATVIEIHCELISSSYAIDFRNINFFNKIKTIDINNNSLNIFKKEFLFIYLCIHGSKHVFERVSWICDINKLLIDKTINWKLLIRLSEVLNVKRIILSSIYLASIVFDTKLPSYIKSIIEKDSQVKKISNKILLSLDKNKMSLTSLSILISQREGIYDKLHFLFKSLFSVKDTDIKFIKLPKYLYFIYFIIRPFRMLLKNLIK